MTKEELEVLGILYIGNKQFPHKFFVPCLGEVNLKEPYNIKNIFIMIYNNGRDAGIKIGKVEKIDEIKKVLGIEIDNFG